RPGGDGHRDARRGHARRRPRVAGAPGGRRAHGRGHDRERRHREWSTARGERLGRRAMIAAAWPHDDPRTTRLLLVDAPRGALRDGTIGELASLLAAGDLLVVNDAATLPGSLRAASPSGAHLEVRLAGQEGDGTWRAVLFGAGDWRTRTEDRAAPPLVRAGERLRFEGLGATVARVDEGSPRLVWLSFDVRGAELWR